MTRSVFISELCAIKLRTTNRKTMNNDIRKQAESIDWKNPETVIDFYEKNQILFYNYKILSEDEQILDLINIKCHYINALISKSRFTKAKTFIEHVDILNQKIKHLPDFYAKYEEEKEYYLGLIYGYLKNYSESLFIFERLVKIDPENDMYKEWYTQMKVNLINKQTTIGTYLGLIIMLIDLGSNVIFNYKINSYFFLAGLTLLIGSLIFPYILRFFIKFKFKWK
jgi:tetratricopeptide (TPR) repeat protein